MIKEAIFDIIKSNDQNDGYFTMIKNDNTNIVLALSNSDNKFVELRLPYCDLKEENDKVYKEVLDKLKAKKIGKFTVMTWDIIQEWHELDAYNITVNIDNDDYNFDIQGSAYYCEIPILIMTMSWIDSIVINKKEQKVVITYDTDDLKKFFEEVTVDTRKSIAK